MPRKITNLNKGVYVMISPANSRAIGRLIARTGRTFSKEINMIIEERVRQNDVGDIPPQEEMANAAA